MGVEEAICAHYGVKHFHECNELHMDFLQALVHSTDCPAILDITLHSRYEEQQKKHSDMVQPMIDDYGYNENSAEAILAYASNHLWRDS